MGTQGLAQLQWYGFRWRRAGVESGDVYQCGPNLFSLGGWVYRWWRLCRQSGHGGPGATARCAQRAHAGPQRYLAVVARDGGVAALYLGAAGVVGGHAMDAEPDPAPAGRDGRHCGFSGAATARAAVSPLGPGVSAAGDGGPG